MASYTDFQTRDDRETLSRLDELVVPRSPLSPPIENHLYHNSSSYSRFPITPPPDYNGKYDEINLNEDDVDMDESGDEISALPQFSRFTHVDHGDPLVNSLASPLSALDISDEDDRDFLHDFNNRDRKVQEIITLNKNHFEKVKQSFCGSEEEWQRFLRVLYAKSEIVPDKEWFATIGEFIVPTNPLLSIFEDLICNNNHQTEPNESINHYHETAPDQTSEIDDDYGYPPSINSTATGNSRRQSRDDDIIKFQEVDIKEIRNYPEKLANFENLYPEFFTDAKVYLRQECRVRLGHYSQEKVGKANNCEFITDDLIDSDCEECYQEREYSEDFVDELRANVEEHEQTCEDSKLYSHFVQILLTPRRMMPDDLWEESIDECLNNWPHLMSHLKEIIAYELSTKEDLNNNGYFCNWTNSQEITI
ncbi:14964_t:CDS:1 [Funneliformis geosporum]|uniref:9073_t:CDS:1 n=1 Tax=Funneliformis geosporum TaxID=1117311 RepID=A0A9W4SUM7_9GLOM|nr:14964_t:CDS:1 [Funneliformis geosporum]CAI2181197.1 9073_t:CDS:1 [Funneliformis geosporum]